MSYLIRYFFDAGSGICLWAANEETRERFDYAIDHWELPLGENTQRYLHYLVAWFDTSIDWSAPGETCSRWSEDEEILFRAAAATGLQLMRAELPGSQYEFIDAAAI